MDFSKHFSTRTDQRWHAGYFAYCVLLASVIICLFLWLLCHVIEYVLMVFAFAVLTILLVTPILMRQQSIKLHFYGGILHIHHLDDLDYTISDVPRRVFIFRQNFLERKYNVGRIKVKGTIFYLYGIQNYAETCRYIRENFLDF